jgi:endonuclease IV
MDELQNKKLIEVVEGFQIYFTPLVEHTSIRELLPDHDEKEIAEICEKIDKCELDFFCAKVTAEKEDLELGSDYLGGCFYNSFEEFYTTYKGEYFDQMRDEAINQAKETLNKLVGTLVTN